MQRLELLVFRASDVEVRKLEHPCPLRIKQHDSIFYVAVLRIRCDRGHND